MAQVNGVRCAVCKGNGSIDIIESESDCPFCNGTGEFTKAAHSFMKDHICQCIFLDRQNCPLCGKKCHHNTPNRPRILVAPR